MKTHPIHLQWNHRQQWWGTEHQDDVQTPTVWPRMSWLLSSQYSCKYWIYLVTSLTSKKYEQNAYLSWIAGVWPKQKTVNYTLHVSLKSIASNASWFFITDKDTQPPLTFLKGNKLVRVVPDLQTDPYSYRQWIAAANNKQIQKDQSANLHRQWFNLLRTQICDSYFDVPLGF